MLRIRKRMTGLALAVISLAVVLLAAIAAATLKSSQLGNDVGNPERDKLLATTIMNQAQLIKNGIELAMSTGYDISTITATTTNLSIAFSPAPASITSQSAPVQASSHVPQFAWWWQGAGHLVKIMNVGSGIGNYAIELDPVNQSVCQPIDQSILGNPTVPTSTTGGWAATCDVDASADTALAGKQETCFGSSAQSRFIYYKVALVQ